VESWHLLARERSGGDVMMAHTDGASQSAQNDARHEKGREPIVAAPTHINQHHITSILLHRQLIIASSLL